MSFAHFLTLKRPTHSHLSPYRPSKCTKLQGMSNPRPKPQNPSSAPSGGPSRSQKLEQALQQVRKIKEIQKEVSQTKKPGVKPRHALPEAPPASKGFRDMDGMVHTFPDSGLKRLAAQLLSNNNKRWRYRPFTFPLFTPSGNEQECHFDFHVYDNMNTIVRLIVVVPAESRELWDRLGRFKRQYSMYTHEVWTPEQLSARYGRRKLGF
jgi:hypothetical protein